MARLTLFEKPGKHEAFERLIKDGVDRECLPIFSWTLMRNDYDLVVQSVSDSQLSDFFQADSDVHNVVWHAHDHTEPRHVTLCLTSARFPGIHPTYGS